MKKLTLIAIVLTANFAWAHGDHAKPVALCVSSICTQNEIEAAVPKAIDTLTKGGQITSAWANIKVEKTEKKEFKKGTEWVTTLFDAQQKDTTKQRLYIFITKGGYLSGANFTGN